MLLLTSIPPRFSRKSPETGAEIGKDYLARCIQSWRRNGFVPISLNRPDEVDAVSALGIIDCMAVSNREAREPSKFGPCLGAIFDNVPHDQPIAIVNADVYMLYGIGTADRLSRLCEEAVVAGRRLDVTHLGAKQGQVFALGYDLFAFEPRKVPRTVANPIIRHFQLGSPWWDYAFPYACSREIRGLRLKEPFLVHQLHPDRWDPSTWAEIGMAALKACPSIENERIRQARNTPAIGPAIGQAFIDALFENDFEEVALPLRRIDPVFWRLPSVITTPHKRDPIGRKIRRALKGLPNPDPAERDPLRQKFKRAVRSIADPRTLTI